MYPAACTPRSKPTSPWFQSKWVRTLVMFLPSKSHCTKPSSRKRPSYQNMIFFCVGWNWYESWIGSGIGISWYSLPSAPAIHKPFAPAAPGPRGPSGICRRAKSLDASSRALHARSAGPCRSGYRTPPSCSRWSSRSRSADLWGSRRVVGPWGNREMHSATACRRCGPPLGHGSPSRLPTFPDSDERPRTGRPRSSSRRK